MPVDFANAVAEDENMGSAELIRAMSRSGLTGTQLADKVGVSQSQISRFLKREREPKATELVKLAAALNIPLETLILDWVPRGTPWPPAKPDEESLPVNHDGDTPKSAELEIMTRLVHVAFEECGIPPAEAGFLSASLAEAAARLEFHPEASADRTAVAELAKNLVSSIAPRWRK